MLTPSTPGYFIPGPSKWPIIGSAALLCLGFGGALAVNRLPLGFYALGIGALLLVYMLFGWFGEVITESQRGRYSGRVDLSFRWSMSWFIFSEVMFFAAFFGALYYVRMLSVPELSAPVSKIIWPDFIGQWPMQIAPRLKEAFQPVGPWGLPTLNTLLLLTSGLTITWAHWGLIRNQRTQLIAGLALTVLLGLTFLSLQVVEYAHVMEVFNLKLSSGVYGSTFYLLTGFHGVHVLLGTLMLLVMLMRSIKGHFSPEHHFAFEAAAWYWHFVDVVWLGLFVFVYCL